MTIIYRGIYIILMLWLFCACENRTLEQHAKRIGTSVQVYFNPSFLKEVRLNGKSNAEGVPYGEWTLFVEDDSMTVNFETMKTDSFQLLLPNTFDLNDTSTDGIVKLNDKENIIYVVAEDIGAKMDTISNIQEFILSEFSGIASICEEKTHCKAITRNGNLFEVQNAEPFIVFSFKEEINGKEIYKLGYLDCMTI